MKKIFLIILSGVCLSSYGQKMKGKDSTTMQMTNGIGISFQSFDGLNNRIAAFPQYEALKNHMWTLTLGSMNVRKNFISGLSVTGGSSLSGDRGKKSSALRFLSGGLDLGYDVIPSEKLMLFPMVGIGAEGYQAVFYKDNSSVNFNDVLTSSSVQNSIRSVKFTNSFLTYRLGLGFAYKSPKHPGSIGLRVGYTGSFKDRAWKSSENQVLNGSPVDNLSRFQVSLVFSGNGQMMR